MCVSFCHKRRILFFNHTDCSMIQCRWADSSQHGSCGDCQHNQNGRCALTNIVLPIPQGGCCHWNIQLVADDQIVGGDQLGLLPFFSDNNSEIDILESYGVPFGQNGDDLPIIRPDDLALPNVYGIGVETDEEAEFPAYQLTAADHREIAGWDWW